MKLSEEVWQKIIWIKNHLAEKQKIIPIISFWLFWPIRIPSQVTKCIVQQPSSSLRVSKCRLIPWSTKGELKPVVLEKKVWVSGKRKKCSFCLNWSGNFRIWETFSSKKSFEWWCMITKLLTKTLMKEVPVFA